MPTFYYECRKCDARFDFLVLPTDDHEPRIHSDCEATECDGEIERRVTAAALEFKGAGFYTNDYKGRK